MSPVIASARGASIEAAKEARRRGRKGARRGAAAAEETETETAPEAEKEGLGRVLVVEDNVDAAESLMMLLELLGHRVGIAHDGAAALEAARADLPDVMLVDIGLPGMDGYDVARSIRADPELKRVYLIALTGYGGDEDRQRALAAGFDHHLVKPVDVNELQEVVARLTSSSGAKQSAAH